MAWGKRPEPPADDSEKEALDTAWRIHGALVDWTGKVDAKASFAFALESAGLGVIVSLSGKDRLFGELIGPWQNIAYIVAAAALVFGAGCAMWVVIPRLRATKVRGEWPDNFIYFGHLKFWRPEDLPTKIKSTEMLPVITNQMVRMSKIAWMKHVLVVISLSLASIAGMSLLLCAVLVRMGLTP